MLKLSDEELDTFTVQLAAILDHAQDVESLDVGDVEPTQHPYPLANVFREDVAQEFTGQAQALAMAPEAEDGRFKVPPALGEEP